MSRDGAGPYDEAMDPAGLPPATRYQLLGPVEVRSACGERLALGTPMQVRLLAVLMSQPGTGWSIDQLVDELWQGRPPKTAAGNVKTYVWALRRALRSPGLPDPAILAGPTGYHLALDGLTVDSVAFDDLAQRGYSALRQGHWSAAQESFEAALALWRGEPFAGLPGWGVLLSVRTRLQEQRSSLVEEVADLQLRAGRHHELIEPLRSQVDADPLRERPWGQLMVALARAGRRADALATYRQLRQLLAEEVGVEPGPDLQHLHTRILRADRELSTSDPRPPERCPPRVVPRQLPAPPALFTGRAGSWPGSPRCCSVTPARPAPSSSPARRRRKELAGVALGARQPAPLSPTDSSTSTWVDSAPRRRRRHRRPSSYARSCPPWV